jgi:hypothetical protein
MAPVRWLKRDSALSWLILIIALIGLLGLLAALQYSWLGQVGVADRECRAGALQSSAARFGEDFDRDWRGLSSFFNLTSRASISCRANISCSVI